MTLFLDTNILIDFLLERQPFYPASAMIVSYAVEGKIRLGVSSLSVVTANYICVERCKMPTDIYRRKMDFLRNCIEVCPVTSENIYSSYDARWKDFEDGVQYAVAKDYHADYIVTRNARDFEDNDVSLLTAEQMCEAIKASECELGASSLRER